MRQMQDKILDAIERNVRVVKDDDQDPAYEVVVREGYANTGLLYLQGVGGFRTALVVGYNFQGDGCQITFRDPASPEMLPNQKMVDGRLWIRADGDTRVFSFKYHEHQQVTNLLGCIQSALRIDLQNREA